MEQYIIKFEETTKFPLMSLLERMNDFVNNSLPEIEDYFSGSVETIDSFHLKELKELIQKFVDLIMTFNKFSVKLSNVGFWELAEYCTDLQSFLEKVSKMPKFKKTSFNYGSFVDKTQSIRNVGGQMTFEKISEEMNLPSENWIDFMIKNQINEQDWDISELKSIKVFTPNERLNVESVLDQPIGERVYGIDVNKQIDFEDNDLSLLKYYDNVIQKCDILGGLMKGDVPEFPNFGLSDLISNVNQFIYPKISNEIKDIFLQNDLFESVDVKGFNYESSDVKIEFEVKTKYDYKTEISI